MEEVLARPAAGVAVDEAAARRTLRAQLTRLERDLSDAMVSAFGHGGVVAAPPPAARVPAPRLPTLGELEAQRDALAARVAGARRALADRTAAEEAARVRLERMLLDPGRHRFEQVRAADLGEGGCGVYRVCPRLGLIGMLAGWWHVTLSSGCPLRGGPCGGAGVQGRGVWRSAHLRAGGFGGVRAHRGRRAGLGPRSAWRRWVAWWPARAPRTVL